jgi:hypothetical protein
MMADSIPRVPREVKMGSMEDTWSGADDDESML